MDGKGEQHSRALRGPPSAHTSFERQQPRSLGLRTLSSVTTISGMVYSVTIFPASRPFHGWTVSCLTTILWPVWSAFAPSALERRHHQLSDMPTMTVILTRDRKRQRATKIFSKEKGENNRRNLQKRQYPVWGMEPVQVK